MAAGCHPGFDRTGNSVIRSADPENPTLSKHEMDRMTRCADMAIRNSISWGVHLRPQFFQGRGRRRGSSIVPLERAMLVPICSPLWPLRYLWPFSYNLPSNVCDAQFDGGLWVTLGQNFRVFPLKYITDRQTLPWQYRALIIIAR